MLDEFSDRGILRCLCKFYGYHCTCHIATDGSRYPTYGLIASQFPVDSYVSQSRNHALRFSSFLSLRLSLKALISFLLNFLPERSAFKLLPS